MRWKSCIAAFAVAAMLLPALAQEKKPAEGKELRSSLAKREKCACSACTVNFPKELGVPLDFLSDIGHRIHRARLTPDPVGLALAAQNLAVAEKVSGKKASVTSDSVLKEAITLAKLRGDSTELQALAVIVTDEATQKELQREAAAATKREADQTAAIKAGETPRAIVGTLFVTNHSGECLRIFVDGRFVGIVHEGHSAPLRVHSHNPQNILQAVCVEDGDLVQQTVFFGNSNFVNWHIDN